MGAPRCTCLCRGAAVVLASGFAISLTMLFGGMVPALADPAPPVTTTAAPPAPVDPPSVTTTTPPVTTTEPPATTTKARARPQDLTLDPPQGGAGTTVTATTTNRVCFDNPQSMSLQWDDGPLDLASAPVAGTNGVEAKFAVPDPAPAGLHKVTAQCSLAQFTITTEPATFKVVGGSATNSGTSNGPNIGTTNGPSIGTTNGSNGGTTNGSGGNGLLTWVIALLAGGVGAYFVVRWRRRHRRPTSRVRAVVRPGGPPVVTVHETPAPGEAARAVRLEAHPDPGIQTIREVDDDHGRPE